MSETNVEVADKAADAVMERERAAFLVVHDENVEVVTTPDWPEPGVRGAEAAWEFYLENFDAFGHLPVESVDAGGDKVLLHYRRPMSDRGIAAGIGVDYWNLATIRQGRVIRAQWFADRVEALEAAGLSE